MPLDPEMLQKYLRNECSPEEAALVVAWLAAHPDHAQSALAHEQKDGRGEHPEFSEEALEALLARNAEAIEQRLSNNSGRFRFFIRSRFRYWVGAAAIAGVLLCSLWWFTIPGNPSGFPASEAAIPAVLKPIAPGTDKAVLTLADGSQLVLDEAHNGNLAEEGDTKVIKLDGEISYKSSKAGTVTGFNTISTPKGGQYKLILSDGTKVWLNAESSLRFPVSFSGNERRVELTGEGYFEVAQVLAQSGKAKIPFFVSINKMGASAGQVEVLGTHFNVMAYGDETAVKTTLLEGRVRVKNSNSEMQIEPGQQANWQQETLTVQPVDVDEVIAWKEGYFQFDRKAPIEQVMRQIARWYDVEVAYEGAVPNRRFGGKIGRDSKLEDVLKMLELNHVKFKVQNRRITVTP